MPLAYITDISGRSAAEYIKCPCSSGGKGEEQFWRNTL